MRNVLIGLTFIILLGILSGIVIWRGARVAHSVPTTVRQESDEDSPIPSVEDLSVRFGYKCIWLEVKTSDMRGVADAMGVKNVTEIGWVDGVTRAYEKEIFITPPVKGWVFIVGFTLPDAGQMLKSQDADRLLRSLSQKYGEALYFETYRVDEVHAWARALDGHVMRAYAYSGSEGEFPWIVGASLPEETALNLMSPTSAGPEPVGAKGRVPFEKDVMRIAGKWAINPMELTAEDVAGRKGLIGTR